MKQNDFLNNEIKNNEDDRKVNKIVMATFWTCGENTEKKYKSDVEDFIRYFYKGIYRVVCSNIRENEYLDYDYYIDGVHIASVKGSFSQCFFNGVFNLEKWREESIPNEWFWRIEWYWEEMENELWMWFGKTRDERFQDDHYYQYYWSSFYGGIEGEDYIFDEFGTEIQLTGCMQAREDSFDDLENV